MNQSWLNGWKEICAYTGFCEKTLKKYQRKYKMPIKQSPSGHRICLKLELDLWLQNFNKKVMKNST